MKTIINLEYWIDDRTCDFIAPHVSITYVGRFDNFVELRKSITERLEQAQNSGQLDLETEAGSDNLKRIVDDAIRENIRS